MTDSLVSRVCGCIFDTVTKKQTNIDNLDIYILVYTTTWQDNARSRTGGMLLVCSEYKGSDRLETVKCLI